MPVLSETERIARSIPIGEHAAPAQERCWTNVAARFSPDVVVEVDHGAHRLIRADHGHDLPRLPLRALAQIRSVNLASVGERAIEPPRVFAWESLNEQSKVGRGELRAHLRDLLIRDARPGAGRQRN